MTAGVRGRGREFGDVVSEYMSPEQLARRDIDEQLTACGWVLQDFKSVAVAAARGVAVREVPTTAGPADYVLYVDRQAIGVIEAKKAGMTLTGVEPQTRKYQAAYPEAWPAIEVNGALPFGYESTGTETRFTSGLDPVPASRRVFTFHRPDTLARWLANHAGGKDSGLGLRAGVMHLPGLDADAGHLWPAQEEAIRNLEQSFKDNRPRALVQMATGSGKTFTAANVCYRLLRHAGAERILFLVDRANLGRQALREFQGFATPDDGRKFTEIYNVRHLTSSRLDIANEAATKVHICTIQRLHSILRGDDELDEALDEKSGFEIAPSEPIEVAYNRLVPIESYDLIIIDECHRSIYGVWRQVLEYFDAFLVGLTATPGMQTFGFFDQNLVMEYGHAQAVADRVNVDFDVFRIRTEITESGGTVPAEFVTKFRDRDTREHRLEKIDEDITYDANQLDRSVVAPDQIRTVVRALRSSLPEMFPDRERREDGSLRHIPKTLIFAKDDSHADDIVQAVRQEFNLGNEGAVKITYRSGDAGNKPEDLLAQFRTSYETRIAVTVDMIATGTDVKPIECVVFMRMVRSRNFFEQMKGRGVRVIDSDQLRAVTPDAAAKDRFVIVDAVGVTEADLHDTVPMERQRTKSFDKLLTDVGMGSTDPDVVSSVASRLTRLDRRMTAADRTEVENVAGVALTDLVRGMVNALDVDRQYEAAVAQAGGDPTPDQVKAAATAMIREALQPLAGNSALREKLVEVRRSYEQAIDEASKDQLIINEFSKDAADRARAQVESWRQFIDDNKDEITALQVLYSQPYSGGLSYDDVKELANAIKRPPHRWTPDALWDAYETLDKSKVRGSGHRVSTDLVSLVRYTLGEADILVSYPDLVSERFEAWLLQQSNAGRSFSQEQAAYLELIKDRIATNLGIAPSELMAPPFSTQGGLGKAKQLFGEELDALLDELTAALAA
ncbi:DEAD/DEAH box helicase family protein [Candidatus Poriferisodalis multihospitum]|uniref:type I restriction endonuclease subunit R n=1 Tax=Candidatus Poriferisodalis multihospitum TaxID=2983191 RepID=UPI002B25823E|nr:DEAD/DEAH box helicase family protein [Candidatus Poriferisodalis multihospitum]